MFDTTQEAPVRVNNRFDAPSITAVTLQAVVHSQTGGGTDKLTLVVTNNVEVPQHEFMGEFYTNQVQGLDLFLSQKAFLPATNPNLKRLAEVTGNQAYGGTFDSIDAIIEAMNLSIGKQFTLSLEGEASYKPNSNGGFYRNVYAKFNPFLNKGTELPRAIEAAKDFDKVFNYFNENPLTVLDKGEPVDDTTMPSNDDLSW